MNKKAKTTLIILYSIAFLITCFGATMAYFTVLNTAAISQATNVEAATMTSIIYNSGTPISIHADLDNFAIGMDSLTDSTFAEVTLTNGSSGTTSELNYIVSFDINENTFVYTTAEKTAELLINFTDPDGNTIENIEGLEYKTVNDISGFDITDKMGSFIIKDSYLIATENVLTQRWYVTLTLVNLDSEQNENIDKTLIGNFKLSTITEDGGENG